MTKTPYVLLEERGVLAVSGEDTISFLQGLVSNDVTKVAEDRAIHAALLTPQGKYLHDFFILRHGERLLLDCEAARLPDLMKRLKIYKLRAKCTLEDCSDAYTAAAVPGATASTLGLTDQPGTARALDGGVIYMDPRLSNLGARALLPSETAEETLTGLGLAPSGRDTYDQVRVGLGVPDGTRDLVVEKSILLESGFDELNGVDWDKGCYMGQELTARTKYRGLIKKRLMPVTIDGPAPEAGTPVMIGETEAGEMRSVAGNLGLALLRLERIEKAREEGTPLKAGDAVLTPNKPDWATF